MELQTLKPKFSILHNIELYEPINYDILIKLMNSSLVETTSNDIDWMPSMRRLVKYIKNYNKQSGLVKVKYTRGNIIEFGRVNPVKTLGLHSINRKIRHTITKDILIDIDIVNAHPTILLQICKKYNYPCKYLNDYVFNRDVIINKYINKYNITKHDVKQLFIMLINGASFNKWLSDNNLIDNDEFLENFNNEMKCISREVIKHNNELNKYIKTIKGNNKANTVIAYYLQTIECYILEEIFNYCRINGIISNVCVLSNDGIMIPTNNYYDGLLDEFKNIIYDKLHLDITFKIKPLNDGYTDNEINDAQLGIKKYDDFFNDLDLASHYFLASKFMELYDDDNYIYKERVDKENYGWYMYNNNNIIQYLGDTPPISLSIMITDLIQKHLQETYTEMTRFISPDMPKFKKYTNIYKQVYKNVGNHKYKLNIINEFKYYVIDNDITDKLDYNNKLLAFNDVLFDFNICKYRNINKDDYIMTTCGYNAPINENKKIRNELKHIISTIFENKNLETYFLDIIGYSLFTNKFEKLHMLSGTGGNGKSLIMDLTNNAFGKYFFVPDSKFLTTKYRSNAPNPDLFKCKNKRIVMISEPEGDSDGDIKFNIEFIKRITGRDVITTRNLHESSTTFKPKFTLFVQTNEPPKLEKVDQALIRRFMCLNFPFNFVLNPIKNNHKLIDATLKDKVANVLYYSEFMGILIENIKSKVNLDLVIPNEINEYTNEYLNDNNYVKNFLDRYIEFTDNNTDKLNLSQLYDKYKETSSVELTKSKFKYNLKQNDIIEKKIMGVRFYTGLKFKNLDGLDD